jgi:hypothetical protein
MGSIDLCISCGAKDTTGIQLTVVETGRSHARYEPITELCFSCASVVTDGLVALLIYTRKDAVFNAMTAVVALRDAVTAADGLVARAEAQMEQARQFEVQAPRAVEPPAGAHVDRRAIVELLPLVGAIDCVRDALDAVLLRPDVLPIASEIGNELECALERVMDARRLVVLEEEQKNGAV